MPARSPPPGGCNHEAFASSRSVWVRVGLWHIQKECHKRETTKRKHDVRSNLSIALLCACYSALILCPCTLSLHFFLPMPFHWSLFLSSFEVFPYFFSIISPGKIEIRMGQAAKVSQRRRCIRRRSRHWLTACPGKGGIPKSLTQSVMKCH